jgi:hypothetical protein
MAELMEHSANVLVIHYSCESFYERKDGRTPRVTSIAVRSLSGGNSHSFSIHKVAELQHISRASITPSYDRLEKDMLAEFFEFVRTHQGHRWVHWNMRDINYGFPALEHRFRVLQGRPTAIDDSKKIDLARLLSARYGVAYIGHPRLESLVKLNGITVLDFLPGAQEAKAFEDGDYVKLHQSTLRKVDILASIVERAANGSLKTNAKWHELYGLTPEAVGEMLKEHWFFAVLGVLSGVAGLIALAFAAF